MNITIWPEADVNSDLYQQFLEQEGVGVTYEECVENRIAEISYCIWQLQREREALEERSGLEKKNILVDSFLEKLDRNPQGKQNEITIVIDNITLDSEISPRLEMELLRRHVDEWWFSEDGTLKIETKEAKLFNMGL